ncbi:XrtA system polysaccharide deacetylase [Noviherbaspirillum galbum]|nr:XrtA system polysaccharide deacetylase [Noviherbaspirillum galbum]
MSVDVEDYFQVSAFAPYIDRAHWDAMPCRVERNVDRILGVFEGKGVKATFFTLGWIAERYPAMVRRIHAAGHEIASHGHGHQRVSEQTPEAFFDDILRAKLVLEDVTGAAVSGYRAPSFSINGTTPWAWDMLRRAGYRYSSSVYPVRHDHYGMRDAPRFPFYPTLGADLLELPITTARVLSRNLPAGGGGYFRLLPYAVSRWMIARVNAQDGRPGIFYFHPWEIDPDQPRPGKLDPKTRFRHYVNLRRTQRRISTLAQDFRWDRIDRIFLEQE